MDNSPCWTSDHQRPTWNITIRFWGFFKIDCELELNKEKDLCFIFILFSLLVLGFIFLLFVWYIFLGGGRFLVNFINHLLIRLQKLAKLDYLDWFTYVILCKFDKFFPFDFFLSFLSRHLHCMTSVKWRPLSPFSLAVTIGWQTQGTYKHLYHSSKIYGSINTLLCGNTWTLSGR